LRGCLLEQGSLTQYLQKFCHDKFCLQLKDQSWKRPMQDESLLLDLKEGEYALIREVLLRCDNTTWVYARSIFPKSTLSGAQRRLATLGRRPLGDILFADRSTIREYVAYAEIPATNMLYRLIDEDDMANSTLWGRRSIFQIQHKPLLVTEIFLPAITQCMNTGK
jgi:chorismate--pyruvate lyase